MIIKAICVSGMVVGRLIIMTRRKSFSETHSSICINTARACERTRALAADHLSAGTVHAKTIGR